MKSKIDYSYGIIPIRKVNDEWEVFLIHQYSKIGNNSYWVFPKGHPEGEETPKETAIRELKEETGMTAETILTDQTFDLNYSFTFDGVRIKKTVQFFIGILPDQEFKLQADEVKEAGWYSLADADERLDYNDTKKMFQAAKHFLSSYKA